MEICNGKSLFKKICTVVYYCLFTLLILLSVALLFKLHSVFHVEWYSVYIDNDLSGITLLILSLLQLFFIFCFKPVRIVFLFIGAVGYVVLTMKLKMQPFCIAPFGSYQMLHSWPSQHDINSMRELYSYLFLQGLLFPVYCLMVSWCLIKPIKYIGKNIFKLINWHGKHRGD